MTGIFFIRHAIRTAKITTVDDGDAQIAQRSVKSILKKILNHQIICVSRISSTKYERRDTSDDYSVVTVFTLSKAPFIVCQERLAHLTRAGKCQIPEKTESLPKTLGSLSGCSSLLFKRWNWSNKTSTSWRVLPLRLVVISEADALEIAQPSPSKETSSITLPGSCTCT